MPKINDLKTLVETDYTTHDVDVEYTVRGVVVVEADDEEDAKDIVTRMDLAELTSNEGYVVLVDDSLKIGDVNPHDDDEDTENKFRR